MRMFKSVKKEYMLSISISLIIVLLVFTNIYRINYGKKESIYRAEQGSLNLRDWDLENEELIKLDGEWEFYSGKLIEPGQNFDKETREYVEVPGDWNQYLKGQGLENESGTYRLTIKLPEDMIYGIKAKTIRYSHRIYLNGEELIEAGNPSLDKNTYIAESRYKVGLGNSFKEEIELIVHVTSLNYRSGGIIKSLEIGSAEKILEADNKNILLDGFVVAICLSLALNFFAMYLQRNKEAYLVYFSGVNLFMAAYLSTMNEQILRLLYPHSLNVRTSLQAIFMVLTTMCFLKFIQVFFEKDSNKRLVNIFNISMLTVLLVAILSIFAGNLNIGTESIKIVIIMNIILAYIYMSYVLVKAIYRKTDAIEYILIIATCMASYWSILFIKVFTEIDLGNTHVFIIILMMLSISGLMSDRFNRDYQKAKKLSENLEKYEVLRDDFFEKSSIKSKRSLQAMMKATRKLLEGEEGVLNPAQQEGLFKIYQETEGLERVADDLLDISLIKTGELELSSSSIDIYSIVEDLLKEIEILIPYDHIIIVKNEIAKDFPPLKVDRSKFRQILYNLIDNAIKYTNNGQITISAKLDEKDQAQVKVRDTGIGIKEKELKEIFNMFYQKNEDENLEDGLGMGLYTVKRLVEIQGGQIEVESIIGKGTTFTLNLPLFTEEDKKDKKTNDNEFKIDLLEEGPVKEKNRDTRKEKILIVKNKAIDEKLLNFMKKELDYKTILVNSGKKALEAIENEKIDLVVLDFILSDMTSNELSSRIREKYSMGELPILVLTSSGKTTDLMRVFNYGVNDFQIKPVKTEELKSRIQSLLLIKKSGEEGLEKEFQYFYSQISPHFLYNTLNSIIGLSYKDGDKAREALNNLAVYLRGKLDIHRKKGFVRLETELELVKAYLEIEELRYGERLEIVYNIEEGLNAKIPPLTLQPIIENAINHGIEGKARGKLEVITKKEKGFINISIQDNGKGMTDEERKQLLEGNGKGIGFKNVMERIKILKGASLRLETELGKGTRVKIIIPEVKNSEENEDIFS